MTPNPRGINPSPSPPAVTSLAAGSLPVSRSLADIRVEQADNLERLRDRLINVDPRDLVPQLVARHVLRANEMSAVYALESPQEQLGKLIEILKTKNHWIGPLTDALIRNGHGSVAEELMKISSSRSPKVLAAI
uniref:CARD domain-containing protein n=1 Tax=Panagrellus redivivus TaxID=6233 RepID=A0A7E4ZWF8_PANRE